MVGRTVVLSVLSIVCLVVAVAASADFATHFLTFVYLCLYVLVPWSAINLADFYVVCHGKFDVAEFFKPHAGVYGNWNNKSGLAFLIGLVVQVPFVTNEFYTGPLVTTLGGADFAWLVGFVVSFSVYLLIARSGTRPIQASATSDIPVAVPADEVVEEIPTTARHTSETEIVTETSTQR
ncbi:cytosine permease [Gordonia sp. Z-3]|uniref:cytosine permease n=1 Tax=Gordonia sp. Z-3 TaxID=3115408 RepID=UPI002E27C96E|nr:cytosine permease [Gordonia sp. Z-3]MED5803840.1 cytosine permease [Gordonia sp. Z-3]